MTELFVLLDFEFYWKSCELVPELCPLYILDAMNWSTTYLPLKLPRVTTDHLEQSETITEI